MAQSKKNKKEKGATSRTVSNYLFLYNLVQLIGWLYIFHQFVTGYIADQPNYSKLWNRVFLPVAIVQTLAVLEIVNVILGFAKTSIVITSLQILFRIVNTYGVFNLLPPSVNTIGIPMTLLAWCGAEITRYSFFVLKELNFVPYFVTWIRYSAFIVLIPIGVGGELLGQYYVQSIYANKWTYFVPQLNYRVGYRHLIILMMLSSAQGVVMMYKHMFTQRRKALNTAAPIKSKSK